jgi:hypothetical protein
MSMTTMSSTAGRPSKAALGLRELLETECRRQHSSSEPGEPEDLQRE